MQLKETEYFLKHFKGHTTITCQSTADTNAFFSYVRPLEECAEYLKENSENGFNVFFTVNETSSSGRKAEHIETIRAVFADDDNPKKEPIRFPLEPSIVVRSSGDEHNGYKFQYYWLTSTEDYKTWERVLLGIIAVYETDKNTHDLARILRLPGFPNQKYDPPTPCTLISCPGTIYDWETILEKFPPIPEAEVAQHKQIDFDKEFNEHKHINAFKLPNHVGDVTNSLNSLIAHWAYHYSSDKIKRKIEQLYLEIPMEVREEHKERYYQARVQAEKFIKTAKEKVARQRGPATVSTINPVIESFDDMPDDLVWDWSSTAHSEFSSDQIVPYLYDAAKEVGNWNGIGPGPAVVSAMSICSALLNKNVVIHETYEQLTHFCSQGSIIVMDTGASKSSIYEGMNKPFFDYEQKLKDEWDTIKNTNLQIVKALESDMKKNHAKFSKKGDHTEGEIMAFAKEQGEKQDKIDKVQITSPSLHTNDITEEAMFDKLFDNNGTIALISDDARKPINILLGEYKQGATAESIYISGFSGTAITNERKGQLERRVQSPALNCLYFVQPDTALRLRESEMYVPSGLAARMPMFFYPTDGADIVKNRQRRDLNHSIMAPYYSHLQNLCVNRSANPLHIRLSERGMQRCKEFDYEFVEMLQAEWHGEFAKLNKLVSTSLQYATCLAALDDPMFGNKYRTPGNDLESNSYELPLRYMNMGFEYAKVLFSQSIFTGVSLEAEGIPRKAQTFLRRLDKFYKDGKIFEGFVNQGDFVNAISKSYREDLPDIIDFLIKKKWLFTTTHEGDKRKLNRGFPNKLVDQGDLVLHLNRKGIAKRTAMRLDRIENRTDG